MAIRLQILLIALFSLVSWEVYSQKTINGKVIDKTSGEPLAGATVLEEGTTNGTVTDINGSFTINVTDQNAILRFSYLGYLITTRVANSTNMTISLAEDTELMEEVIVTALGFEEVRDNLGYANSKVEGRKLVDAGEPTLLNSLSGKSSGVRITRNSGDPGAGAYIQIRGLSTITRSNQPLIVVDGIPISNATRNNSASGGVNQESRLNDLNPNDIESISVLKGATAAALWGTQALGGVLLITTKSGKFASKLRVAVQSTYSIDVINRKYPLQTRFGQGDNGVFNARARDSWGDRISDRSGGQDEFITDGEFFVDQDGRSYFPIANKNSREIFDDSNFDQIFDNGSYLENSVVVSGGNQNSTLYFSLSDLDQQGIIRNNSDYRRTTARANIKHLFTQDVQLKVNTTYSRTASNRIQKGANSSGLYLGLLRTPPDFDNSGYRGSYFAGPNAAPVINRHRSYREPLAADGTPVYNNPNWTINEQDNQANVNRFITSFELTVSPIEWLDLVARVGVDHYSERKDQFFTPGSASGAFRVGLFEQNRATNTIFNMDYIAKANFQLSEKFTFDGLVGFNYNARTFNVNEINIVDFILFADAAGQVRDIENALPENVSIIGSEREQRTSGVYTSVTFSGWEMLYLTGTLRAETASTFGDGSGNANTFDFTFLFPSVSLAWQFSEIGDLQNDIFSFGKLRASYGQVGVQPEAFRTTNVFDRLTFGDSFGGDLDLGLYGNGGFVPRANRGNSALKPERKEEFEIGTDLRFLKNRLSFSATYFNNTTKDVLLDFPIANSTGFAEIYTNAGDIKNEGWELDLGYNVLQIENFSWDILATYTRVRNEVTNLQGIESINLGGLAAVNARAVEGQPLGVLWGSRTLRNDDGSIVFDENGFPVQDEVEGVIGDPNPDWQGSFQTTFKYKNFTLRALFETYQGADIYAGTKSVLFDLGRWEDSANEITATRNLRTSTGDIIFIGETFRGNVFDFGAGPVALTESWYNGDGGFFGNGNDELYIEDGSWTRLRELSLTYTLSSEWLQSTLGLSTVKFTATGRNLILWTDFEGNDPDTNLSGVSVARGIDYFNNPGTKSYVFSLLLSF